VQSNNLLMAATGATMLAGRPTHAAAAAALQLMFVQSRKGLKVDDQGLALGERGATDHPVQRPAGATGGPRHDASSQPVIAARGTGGSERHHHAA